MTSCLMTVVLMVKGEKMRLINPTRAEERIVALYRKEKGYAADIFNTAVDAAQTIILDMYDNEAIEAEPVKHGQWIESWGGKWHSCSVCGGILPFNFKGEDIITKYCPHCGAKMDEEE